MHVSDDLIVAKPHNPKCGQPHADEGRTHSGLFTGRAPGERCAPHGLERISLRTAGYYALPPRLARVPIRLDPLQGAFLVGMFEVRRRQGVT